MKKIAEVLGMCVLLLWTATSPAGVVWSDNFDNYSDIGEVVSIGGWTITDSANSHTLLSSDYSVSPSNSLHQRSTALEQTMAISPTFDPVSSGTVSFQAMSLEKGYPEESLYVTLMSGGSYIAYIKFGADGFITLNYASPQINVPLVEYNAGQWYKIDVSFDKDTQALGVSVDGVFQGTYTGYKGSSLDLNNITVKQYSYSAGSWAKTYPEGISVNGYVDDFVVIPEPASIAILSLGGIALMIKRFKH